MARTRYQKGSLFVRGIREPKWVARWREDVIVEGAVQRVYRSEVIGTVKDFPTRKLALRELDGRLVSVNDPRSRARPTATFSEFADRWLAMVLTQHKPSTQAAIRSQVRRHLIPFFGRCQMRDLHPELAQQFVSLKKESSPKTVRNLVGIFRMMVNSARAWGYFLHDPLSGIKLPKGRRSRASTFSLKELQAILGQAKEPHRTFYLLAAETGMRAGELCGLREDDLDFDRGLVFVRQSAWQGKLQDPKTENSVRCFALSPQMIEALRGHLRCWRPNGGRLLFATRNGTPWDPSEVVKRRLHPLLDRLGLSRCGLHAFRHANSSLMDRLSAPIKVRQERLGHSDPRQTLGTYTHAASEDDATLAVQLGRILHPIAPKLEERFNGQKEEAVLVQ